MPMALTRVRLGEPIAFESVVREGTIEPNEGNLSLDARRHSIVPISISWTRIALSASSASGPPVPEDHAGLLGARR